MFGIFIYQIQHASAEERDPGFLVLDNSAAARADWYEYWPMRTFLLRETLDESAFYGFVSPKFRAKTNLTAAAAHEFVRREGAYADVVLLSPSLHLTAYYWNVFQYGDSMHPGLLQAAEQFFRLIGRPTDLGDWVTNSTNEVYSNYVVARPRFWRAWLAVTEQLFTLAESHRGALATTLREPTHYRGERNVQMKIFLMERLATWLLASDSSFVVRVHDPFTTRSRAYKLPGAIVGDALKIAYVSSADPAYRALFGVLNRWGKVLSWLVRLGSAVGFRGVSQCVGTLAAYWTRAGEH